LLEAAKARGTADLKTALDRYEASRDTKDHLAKYRETLAGGDAEAGRRIFFDKAAVSCVRCHKLNGTGGEVGPDLTGIGKLHQRDYLLASIVLPDKQIAKGYETVVLVLTSGTTRTGIVKSEDGKEVRLMTADGLLVTVPRDQIDERLRGKSAMPDDLVQHLSARELRDLVEFLAGLKDGPP